MRVAQAQLPDDPALRWKSGIPITEELKIKAKKLGLWNLFLSKAHYPQFGVPLTNLEVNFTPTNLLECKSDKRYSTPSWQKFLVASARSRPSRSTALLLTPGIWVCASTELVEQLPFKS